MRNVDLKGNKITVPSEGDYYIYEIIANWPEGKITYVFDVEPSFLVKQNIKQI